MTPLNRATKTLEVATASLTSSPEQRLTYPLRHVRKALAQIRLLLVPTDLTLQPKLTSTVLVLPLQPNVAVARKLNGYARPKLEKPKPRPRKPKLPESPGEAEPSDWDPEPLDEQLEASRCRAFLLEIVRRAVYDWVLYRQHDRLELKAIAADAYTWLFEEEAGHPWSQRRQREGRGLTSLLVICEVLDLDPETVRARARSMDIRTILTAGRPPEVRRRQVCDESDYQEHGVSGDVDLSSFGDDPGHNFYENHYSVNTAADI